MSLILDALQRSERESEHSGQAPGLHTRYDPGESSRTGTGYRWFIAAVLLALAASWWGLRGAAGTSSGVETKRTPQSDLSAAAATTVELKPEPESDHEPAPVVVSPVVTPQPAHDVAEIAALYGRLLSAPPAPEPAGAREQVVAAAEEPVLEATPVASHPAPLIVDLSQRVKDQIPSIFFRKHDWSATAATSSVHLNSGVYRVGDTVAPGLRLVEILADSIVLNYRGEEFRLRALNSWINL